MAEMNTFISSKLIPIINKNDCLSICDYGCGKGELLEILYRENPNLKLTGIDYFSKFGKDNPQRKHNSLINYIDKESEEFNHLEQSDKFDLLVSTFTLHHFQYPVTELQSIYKLVKPGGILIFIDFSYENDSRAKITKNISSFIDEMRVSIKGKYHRHHYTLEEAKDLLKAIPVDICKISEIENERSHEEQEEDIKHKLKRNAILQTNLEEKAPDFWKEMWIPFLEHEKNLIENNGLDYSSLLFIHAMIR